MFDPTHPQTFAELTEEQREARIRTAVNAVAACYPRGTGVFMFIFDQANPHNRTFATNVDRGQAADLVRAWLYDEATRS